MEKIIRGSGLTSSERCLARLSDKTFLKLWTFPNTFSDRHRAAAGGDGKELCDLLVICGDDVIIFSDKSIAWPEGDSLEVRWSRWYRRAVKKSVDQIRGAERWLRDHPNRVFLDSQCTMRLPVDLPPIDRRRVHGIAIVRGAHQACSQFYDGDDGSLVIMPRLKGDAHIDPASAGWRPFAVGDVDPGGPFVHVFDETALDRVMLEQDTISDFVAYLLARAAAIRNEDLEQSPGESEFLAYYMKAKGTADQPRFLKAIAAASGAEQVALWPGAYEDLVGSDGYARYREANGPSYVWDDLIGRFVHHLMDGSSISVLGEAPSASKAEPALRIMARETRLRRRVLGRAFVGAVQTASQRPEDRYTRVVVAGEKDTDNRELAYVFMTLAYPAAKELKRGYEQYRQVRASMLETYCYTVLHDDRRLKRVVGIAVDTPGRSPGSSEDLMAVEVTNWSPDLEEDVARRRTLHDVLVPGRLRKRREEGFEFPPATPNSRRQHRAAERQTKKRRT